jgi:hypothetical protein
MYFWNNFLFIGAFSIFEISRNLAFSDTHHGGGGVEKKKIFGPSSVLPRIFAAARGRSGQNVWLFRMFYIKMQLLQVARTLKNCLFKINSP